MEEVYIYIMRQQIKLQKFLLEKSYNNEYGDIRVELELRPPSDIDEYSTKMNDVYSKPFTLYYLITPPDYGKCSCVMEFTETFTLKAVTDKDRINRVIKKLIEFFNKED